jgi:predicted ATPase
MKPITILVGPNGSGKSSILQAIALMSQSVGTQLQLEGKLVKYPSYQAIFHKMDASKPMMFKVKINPTNDEYQELLSILNKAELNYNPDFSITYEYVLSYQKIPPNQNDIPIVKQGIFVDSLSLIEVAGENLNGKYVEKVSISSYRETPTLVSTGMLQSFLNPNAFHIQGVTSKKSAEFNKLIEVIINLLKKRLEGRVYFLSSTRGRVEYSASANTDNQWVGANGEFVIQILSKIFSDTKYKAIKDKVINWTNKFGIADLQAGWIGANKLTSTFSDPELKTILDLAVAGFGSRQALAMIVQLFWSKQNDILLIEEPEISLHPEAQIYLPELFAEVIKEKKTLILTTHSSKVIAFC